MTKALDTLGNEVELRGDSPLKLKHRTKKPAGAFKSKVGGTGVRKASTRMRLRPSAPSEVHVYLDKVATLVAVTNGLRVICGPKP